MILAVMRSVGALVLSLVVAFVLVVVVEGFGMVFHPFPPEVDPNDFDVCAAHVAKCPPWVLAVTVLLWGGTMFVGVWIATRLGTRRHPAHGLVVGLLLVAATAFNMYLLPYPIWFEGSTMLIFVLAIYWGLRFSRGR